LCFSSSNKTKHCLSWCFLEFPQHEKLLVSYFWQATWMLFHNWNRLFSLYLYIFYLFMETVLSTVEKKFVKIKESSVHGVSLIFHNMKSFLLTICGNMDAIPYLKQTVFPQLGCHLYIFANYFSYSWVEVLVVKENSAFHVVSLNFHNMNSCENCVATCMLFHNWNRFFSHFRCCMSIYIWNVLATV